MPEVQIHSGPLLISRKVIKSVLRLCDRKGLRKGHICPIIQSMKGRELIRKLKRLGVEIIKGRGKGGHCLAKYKGRQTTIPIHGDVDIAGPFVKELCKQLGIDPKDVI